VATGFNDPLGLYVGGPPPHVPPPIPTPPGGPFWDPGTGCNSPTFAWEHPELCPSVPGDAGEYVPPPAGPGCGPGGCVGGGTNSGDSAPNKEQAILEEAKLEALERLKNPECAKVIGAGAGEELTRATYEFVALGGFSSGPNGVRSVIGMQTFTSPAVGLIGATWSAATVQINTQGPFLDRWSNVQFRAEMLLHEAGHMTGAFGYDNPRNPDGSINHGGRILQKIYNKLVKEKCF
jgi:hypothetical protein